MNRARRALGWGVHQLRERKRRTRALAERTAVAASPALYRRGDQLAALPFRDERIHRPPGSVLEDLVAYTGLSPKTIESLVLARRPINFRGEWHGTPEELRADHWFYLASKTYLFANAPHFSSADEIDLVADALAEGVTVLEFGAGVGNLSIGLAERGHRIVADELNALQRDFLRFRVHRHGLEERIRVLEPWMDVAPNSVDAITAFDVLEHLPDGRETLERRLLPALRPSGVLAENSPFVQNVANPMHHDDWGLDDQLRAHGLRHELTLADRTRVWRRTAG